ncbi:hypothetical protein PGTUg99_005805 [Puccinia graminis f. sp. tritici]|uniref:Uncharacterized protein n=1 Tax=Puccinia graminis f. sp. tritici TaxID=56615 RepID=A0A5B0P6A8_PUCGR|nr:hypothetical protein PGTUg99_005805 [Puccinia graminis f. sp. tritici]
MAEETYILFLNMFCGSGHSSGPHPSNNPDPVADPIPSASGSKGKCTKKAKLETSLNPTTESGENLSRPVSMTWGPTFLDKI